MAELGFFGKIPAKGDFVRHQVTDDAARSFEQWVQESNDMLRGAGGELPTEAIRVVFTPPGSSKTVVAALVPSRDKVGRKFPIVVFSLMPSEPAASHFSALPVAWSAFLEAAVALGRQAETMELDALRAAVNSLPGVGMEQLGHAKGICDRALSNPVHPEVHERLFGALEGSHLYAYHTLLTACADAKKSDPGKPSTVLDCPIKVDTDLFVWLELTSRVFGFPQAPPSFFWVEDPSPRLLLTLGPAPLNTLQFIANPDLDHQRLWPLVTERAKAIEVARRAIGADVNGISDTSPMRQLVDTIAKRAEAGGAR